MLRPARSAPPSPRRHADALCAVSRRPRWPNTSRPRRCPLFGFSSPPRPRWGVPARNDRRCAIPQIAPAARRGRPAPGSDQRAAGLRSTWTSSTDDRRAAARAFVALDVRGRGLDLGSQVLPETLAALARPEWRARARAPRSCRAACGLRPGGQSADGTPAIRTRSRDRRRPPPTRSGDLPRRGPERRPPPLLRADPDLLEPMLLERIEPREQGRESRPRGGRCSSASMLLRAAPCAAPWACAPLDEAARSPSGSPRSAVLAGDEPSLPRPWALAAIVTQLETPTRPAAGSPGTATFRLAQPAPLRPAGSPRRSIRSRAPAIPRLRLRRRWPGGSPPAMRRRAARARPFLIVSEASRPSTSAAVRAFGAAVGRCVSRLLTTGAGSHPKVKLSPPVCGLDPQKREDPVDGFCGLSPTAFCLNSSR